MSEIPIVGQPVNLVFWYPTTILRCRCDPSPEIFTMILITGTHNAVECPKCHKLYQINGMQLDKKGDLLPMIQVMIPTQSKEVM